MVTTAPNVRPSERDRLIFWHVLRYGLTTLESIYRLLFEPESKDLEAARSNLKRLCKGGYLNKARDPVPYYRLTKRAIGLIEPLLDVLGGTYKHAASSLKKPQLIERLAVHAFCCLSDTPRRVLLQHEFIRFFPAIAPPGFRPWPFYIESTPGGSVLCFIVVDSHSHPAHQVDRAEMQIRRRLAVPAIRELLLAGRFRVTLLTTTAQRKSEIQVALYEAHVDGVQLETVSQLSSILLEPGPTS